MNSRSKVLVRAVEKDESKEMPSNKVPSISSNICCRHASDFFIASKDDVTLGTAASSTLVLTLSPFLAPSLSVGEDVLDPSKLPSTNVGTSN